MSPLLDLSPGCVLRSGRYLFTLFIPSNAEISFASALLTVNGEEVPCVRTSQTHATLLKDGVIMYGYGMHPEKSHARPFGLVCGYARMELELIAESGRPVARFAFKDVLCKQDTPVDTENVAAMIEALTGDPAKDPALRWMLCDGANAEKQTYSLLEGGFAQGASRSVPTYLAIIEAGLNAAEAALPFLRSHAASRIQQEECVVDSLHATKMGNAEARWLATHPEALRPSPDRRATIVHKGRRYSPMRISSMRSFHSFNVYENQLCLSYLLTVASSLANFATKLESGLDIVRPFRARENASESECILLVTVAKMLQRRHFGHLKRATQLHNRAIRLLQLFRHALPGVDTVPLSKMRLVRTKTFKEIRAYSQLYGHIDRFSRYGESLFEPDGLAIAALRLDKAYETYVLHRILSWFSENGYVPAREDGAAYAGSYSYTSQWYADKPHVANIYHLRRGTIHVDVYYEPVVFANDQEKHGVTLHRLNGGHNQVYTPDYVIVVRRQGSSGASAKRVFILDAKYRPRRGMLNHYLDDDGNPTESVFEEHARKYLRNMVDAETGRIPDALWLLDGLDDGEVPLMIQPAFPWSSTHVSPFASGIALAAPSRSINPLFEAMGLSARRSTAADSAFANSCALKVDEHDESDRTRTLDVVDVADAARESSEKIVGKSSFSSNEMPQHSAGEPASTVKATPSASAAKTVPCASAAQTAANLSSEATFEQVMRLVSEIVSSTTSKNERALYEADYCRFNIGIDQPLLRRKKMKSYRPLPEHKNVFYYCPRMLPKYVNQLQKYVDRLNAESDQP